VILATLYHLQQENVNHARTFILLAIYVAIKILAQTVYLDMDLTQLLLLEKQFVTIAIK